jgi:hypothetical protein
MRLKANRCAREFSVIIFYIQFEGIATRNLRKPDCKFLGTLCAGVESDFLQL